MRSFSLTAVRSSTAVFQIPLRIGYRKFRIHALSWPSEVSPVGRSVLPRKPPEKIAKCLSHLGRAIYGREVAAWQHDQGRV